MRHGGSCSWSGSMWEVQDIAGAIRVRGSSAASTAACTDCRLRATWRALGSLSVLNDPIRDAVSSVTRGADDVVDLAQLITGKRRLTRTQLHSAKAVIVPIATQSRGRDERVRSLCKGVGSARVFQ